MSTLPNTADYAAPILHSLQQEDFRKATFAGTRRTNPAFPYQRVTIRPVEIRGQRLLQVSSFDGRKDLSRNISPAAAPAELADLLAAGFANVHLTTASDDIDLRLTKKGEVTRGITKRNAPDPGIQPHNRLKDLPLPEGAADHLLEVMGIMTPDGSVRPTMRPKFTQINEFLKLLDTLLPAFTGQTTPLQILDCGCGSSYLTLAAHHYLNHIKNIPAHLLGVDMNEDLIRKSTRRAESLHGNSPPDDASLNFTTGRIGQLDLQHLHPDIVIALHACDTATDDAIAQAIRSNAKALLVAPCCHKNLNKQLHIPALTPLHRHGILHHRFADLVTDSFRALLLRILGYRTDVIEFISPEHTPRNLMIRALKTSLAPDQTPDPEALAEYRAFKSFTQVTPYLESALGPLFPK